MIKKLFRFNSNRAMASGVTVAARGKRLSITRVDAETWGNVAWFHLQAPDGKFFRSRFTENYPGDAEAREAQALIDIFFDIGEYALQPPIVPD